MAVLSFRNFTRLDEQERDLVLTWRNSPRVRSMMTNREPIGKDDHLAFLTALPNREDCRYFLFSVDGVPAGVLDFVKIDREAKACEPGLYVGDERFLGMGVAVYFCALEYAFGTLGCDRVSCTVREENKTSHFICTRVFGARETEVSDGFRRLVFDGAQWASRKLALRDKMQRNLGMEDVLWQ